MVGFKKDMHMSKCGFSSTPKIVSAQCECAKEEVSEVLLFER